jgi:ketosteroid isomerase-like protein
MSENLELVRSIYAEWEQGEMRSSWWADTDIECVIADGPAPGHWRGRNAMWQAWRDFLSVWEDWRVAADGYRELDGERVLVFENRHARARGSGLRIGQTARETPSLGASLFCIRDGKVTRFVTYFDRDRALADLGLKE